MTTNRAVFLDRDGVINDVEIINGVPHPPKNLSDFKILPGVGKAINKIKKYGYKVIIITNQPDIARNKISKKEVEKIHLHIKETLSVDDIYVCEHDDIDECDCRKPKIGLFLKSSVIHAVDLTKSYMVGDRWRDVDAGNTASCKSIYIDRGYTEKKGINYWKKASSLVEAAEIIGEDSYK